MSLSGVPPLLLHLAGRVPPPDMASNDEEDEERMSDSEDRPYIQCEAVYGADDDDDDMSALPFVSTEMREDEDADEAEKMKFGMKAPEVGAYVKCSVPSCHSYFEVGNPKYEGFSHFKFPEDPNMRRRWIGIIGQKDDWKPEGAMICSNHFAESSFVTLLEHVAETGQLMPKRSLKAGAIPTLNLDIPKAGWNAQRLLQSINNGISAAPVARPAASPAVLPATPIRSPYCQARTVTLTKNGKRRGRPPKNRPPDDMLPSVPQMIAAPALPSPVHSEAAPAPNATSTPVTAASLQANGHSNPASVSQGMGNPYGQNQMSPFHLLGMGRRKRGRPRKEESLRRLAEGAAEAAFGWSRTNWRRNNVPVKRRKILPAMGQDSQRRNDMEQLECTIDPINFLQIQHNDTKLEGSPNVERELSRLKSLVSNVDGLSANSLGELCRVVEGTLERLRKAEASARSKKEADVVKSVTKEVKADVEVKLPPSLSIKAVGPKTANAGSLSIDEEPVPALTITIKREGKPVNGDVPLKVEDVKRKQLDVKTEPTETVKRCESDSDNDRDQEEGPAEEEEDFPEGEDEDGSHSDPANVIKASPNGDSGPMENGQAATSQSDSDTEETIS